MQKRFSIKNKLLIVFGLLVFFVGFTLAFLGARTARKAVTEKIETHLKDKATDTATIIDGRIVALFQFLEGIARMPVFADEAVSYSEKLKQLNTEITFTNLLYNAVIADMNGNMYSSGNQVIKISSSDWYQASIAGKDFLTEPFISLVDGKLIMTISVPLYDGNRNILGVLAAAIRAERLSQDIEDIVVGKTGGCYILGQDGTTIAHKDFNLVKNQDNLITKGKTDKALASVSSFLAHAIDVDESEVGYYDYKGEHFIASYATIKSTGWSVIIKAPIDEFMGTIANLRRSMAVIGIVILMIAAAIIFFVAVRIVKPINVAVYALKDIAQGEGDLTVRLPLVGNDEITDLSAYFNQTIQKIADSIREVGVNTSIMEDIGSDLAGNMTETASAVHQISANIDGVKQQALTQAASVTETAATVEEIIRTIKQLNSSIENQAASVAQSSSAVEQMVANIASITQTLDKTNGVIKTLAAATADGRETVTGANSVTQQIAEESGSLLDASNVIQHIASQTNLLAMNAAIEAAHAGEAGKGFAVVADEIRKLAEESSAQGKTITATLKTLSGEIETLSESSKTAGEKFNAIFNLSDQVKDMSNRLMEAMREQENGSREVLGAIKTINTVTTEVQAGSMEMLRGGEGVAEEMHKLDNLTRVIADSMNEMASGAVQIRNAVQDVSEITQKNKASIDSLAKEVKKFKI